jgi:hypothetical protein
MGKRQQPWLHPAVQATSLVYLLAISSVHARNLLENDSPRPDDSNNSTKPCDCPVRAHNELRD